MAILHLILVTPERTLFDEAVDAVTCTTVDGQITLLPGHTALVAELAAGELLVRQKNTLQVLHAGGGFIQVQPSGKVVVLSDAAEHVTEIDAKRAEEALARAKERLAQTHLSDREYMATAALLERNSARLKIVRKHAHRRKSGITGEGVLEE
jgi:F-type H+-transporting ATPase subunit epsilon